MSSYRRFISYMHQYANGKKGTGCGFVKIEIRNNTCTMWFQLKKLPPSDTLSISFFIPTKNSVTFVPIWRGTCQNGILNQRFSTDSLHLFNTNYSFRQCSGIILSKNEEILCGSSWDIRYGVPNSFSGIVTHETTGRDKSDDKSIQSKAAAVLESVQSKPAAAPESIQSKPTAAPESIQSIPAKPAAAPESIPAKPAAVSESIPSDSQTIFTKKPECANKNEFAEISERSKENRHTHTPNKNAKTESLTQPIPFEDMWANMQKIYPPLDPFEEGGVVEGIKVAPSDLPAFDFLPFDISANRFLLHGYKNYKHLLMGRMEGQNRYILGIPGVYDSQEQFMAKMFGFPCFKPIRACIKPVGQFGYWFRCIRS